MRLDNGADNRKSHTHALRLCREKRVENILDILGPDTGTGVADLDFRRGARMVGGYTDFARL